MEELCLENPERRLSETVYAQPAIYVVNALHWSAAQEDLPPADFFAGHSLGEYSALFAAGAFDFETGLTLVRRRAELMGQVSGGAMAAVIGVSEQIVEETLKQHDATGVVIANYNAPEQFVLSGSREELARIKPVFEKVEGVRGFVPVKVSGPFHAPAMAPAAARFRTLLAAVDVGELRTPVISNV
ncbi:acyltransferase domain-containing protein, partial [Streptomyces sp. SID8455]|nr:acyltransferase domain-containing protein [Streptomyces sp. SID8455]